MWHKQRGREGGKQAVELIGNQRAAQRARPQLRLVSWRVTAKQWPDNTPSFSLCLAGTTLAVALVALAHKGLLVVYSFIKLKCKYNLPLKININWCTSSRGKWSSKDKGRRQRGGTTWHEKGQKKEGDSGKAGWQAGNRFVFKSHFKQFTTKTKTHRE